MKYALINPHWTFEGSIYFGCREPHLPLEYGYARSLLERGGHEVLIVAGVAADHSGFLEHAPRRRGMTVMRIVLFCHSLLSDWNHGTAHFLRGIATELLLRGHDVRVFEPWEAWSV
jgi:hypothetical protein